MKFTQQQYQDMNRVFLMSLEIKVIELLNTDKYVYEIINELHEYFDDDLNLFALVHKDFYISLSAPLQPQPHKNNVAIMNSIIKHLRANHDLINNRLEMDLFITQVMIKEEINGSKAFGFSKSQL